MIKKLVILIVISLYLTACNNKNGTINCTMSQNEELLGYNITSNYSIIYKDNYVTEVNGQDIIVSDFNDTIEELENELTSGYDELNELYGGHNYNINKEDNKLIIDININFNELKLKEYIEGIPLLTDYYKNNKLLKDGLILYYEDGGYQCN